MKRKTGAPSEIPFGRPREVLSSREMLPREPSKRSVAPPALSRWFFFAQGPLRLIVVALCSVVLVLFVALSSVRSQEPQVKVGTSKGVRSRVAVADFQMRSNDPKLVQSTTLFNQVLWNDLDIAGVFELVP